MKIYFMYSNKILFLLMCVTALLVTAHQSYAQTVTNNTQSTHNGFFYSFWNDKSQGTASMTLGAEGNYSTTWNNVGNFTAGKGWAKGKEDRVVYFTGTFNGGSNGYLAVYGWTKNPLIEYYVVESYGSWTPPGGNSIGTFTSDGGTYKIYVSTRTDQPSIIGTATFKQYWSVRTTKRSSGTVTFANHVAAWKAKGMELGTTWDYQIMESEGYHSTGSSNITVSETPLTSGVLLPNDASEVDLYPNPTTNLLFVTLPKAQSEVTLLSVNGAQLDAFKTEIPEIKIDMTNYKAGIYLLKIASEGKIITTKVIKE